MRYNVGLFVERKLVSERKTSNGPRLDVDAMKRLCDGAYWHYIDGPRGPSIYVPAEVVIVSGDGSVNRHFSRKPDSNAAGMPDLWVEHKPGECVEFPSRLVKTRTDTGYKLDPKPGGWPNPVRVQPVSLSY